MTGKGIMPKYSPNLLKIVCEFVSVVVVLFWSTTESYALIFGATTLVSQRLAAK